MAAIVEFHCGLFSGRNTRVLALYKCPVGVDGLSQNGRALQLLDGVLGVFVALVLDQRVSLGITSRGSVCLYETGSAIYAHVEVLYRSVFRADVQQIFLLRFLVNVCDKNDPTLDRYTVKHERQRVQGQGPVPDVSILSKRPARPSMRRLLSSPFISWTPLPFSTQ